jgi:hypothetical protein
MTCSYGRFDDPVPVGCPSLVVTNQLPVLLEYSQEVIFYDLGCGSFPRLNPPMVTPFITFKVKGE